MSASTIGTLLGVGDPNRVALAGPSRPPLTYAALRKHVRETVDALNGVGIGRNDRVAIVLPNGPELASAFVGIAAGASAAPLNPAYRAFDFHFYLSDLRARAVVVERDSDSPVIAVARALHIPILQLAWSNDDPAGWFSVVGNPIGSARSDGFADADDTALVLHTAGTTARPKMVPLSQRNLTSSASHIVETLRLTPLDRCLNVMPMFHIHGLMGGVLSSLAAGASLFCTPGFNVLHFYRWFEEAKPTWYTAVPAMHQAILSHAEQNRAILDQVRLRFVRSSSAALPRTVMRELEAIFEAPVIESYGMTEAAHQMASNPLPPEVRKPGTVGRAAGPEIAIMGSSQELLPAGTTGEIVVRGPNVMAGYGTNNADADAATFTGGWFRTGDQGFLDEDGYLTITGRLKEVINRGGQKVAPREVDDALMEHPNIASAATFPIPHPTLGEEIGAAVVVLRGTILTAEALANFLSARLADYKVPRRFVFVDGIPKGSTGKIQRRTLAATLGLDRVVDTMRAASHSADRPPTPLEAKLKDLWETTLGVKGIGLHDNFFLLGGDSLQAVELLTSVEEALGHSLPASVLIERGTIAGMALSIEEGAPSGCVVPFRAAGARPPFFCVHDIGGQVLNLRNLSRHLGDDQPFYAIQAVGADGKRTPLTRVEDMATHYIREMRNVQPVGPYYLGGYSMGGWVAFEMTRQLQAEGEKVALLALIDAYSGQGRRRATVAQWFGRRWAEVSQLNATEWWSFWKERLRNAARMAAKRMRRSPAPAGGRHPEAGGRALSNVPHRESLEDANARAARDHRMRPLACDAVLFKGDLAAWDHVDVHDGWKSLILGDLEIRTVPGRHHEVMDEPVVQRLAAELAECLRARHRHSYRPR